MRVILGFSLILVTLWSGSVASAPMTNAEATAAGKLLGQQQDLLTTPLITDATVTAKIPQATASPPETAFFGGGVADNFMPGDNKRINCSTNAPNPDPFAQQACNAVNLVAKAPAQRPNFSISRADPILQREQAVRANSSTVAFGTTPSTSPPGAAGNPNGFGIAGTYSGCTTATTPDPAGSTTQTCTDFMTGTYSTPSSSCRVSTISPVIDTCAPLVAQGCIPMSSMCAVQDPVTGTCQVFDKTYSCSQQTCEKSTGTNQVCHKNLGFTVVQPATVPATPAYNCPVGSVLIGTQCQAAAFPATVNYSCDAGSVLPGNLCQPAPSAATLSYSCVSGTPSGSGASMTCVQPTISATLTYSCPFGSSLSGTNTCVPAAVNATVTYSCAAGTGTLVNTNQCQLPAYQPAGSAATGTITQSAVYDAPFCGSGREQEAANFKCGGSGTIVGCNSNTQILYFVCNITTYSCPSGYTLSGTTCYPPMVTPAATAATPSYSCPAGYTVSGTTCIAPNTSATPNYSCPVNYSVSGTSCVTPSTAATASYSCPVAGNTLLATSCYPPPVGATVAYTCPSPATAATTTTCRPPNTTAAVTYTCGPGMTLSGSSCVPAAIVTETYTDNCANLQAKTL